MREDTDWAAAEAAAVSLEARLIRYWSEDDHTAVDDPEAMREAMTLAPCCVLFPDSPEAPAVVIDLEALHVLASFHFAHVHRAGEVTPETVEEGQWMLALFACLGAFAPDLVPEPIRDGVATVGTPPVVLLEHELGRAFEEHQRWISTKDPAALETCTSLFRAILECLPAGHPAVPSMMSNLGNCLRMRALLHSDATELDDAIELARRAVRLVEAQSPDRPVILANLATALTQKAPAAMRPEEFDEAVDAALEALHIASDPEDWFEPCAAMALLRRYRSQGSDADLDAAIAAFDRALERFPEGDKGFALWSVQSAIALSLRYARDRRESDLDAVFAAAGRSTGVEDEELAAERRRVLGLALLARFELHGREEDLEESVASLRAAGSDPATLLDLGVAELARFTHTGEEHHADEAVATFERIIATANESVTGQALIRLAETYCERLSRFGREADAEAGKRTAERALAMLDSASARARRARLLIGEIEANLFDLTESESARDRAIAIFSEVFEAAEDDAERWLPAVRLGHLHMRRYSDGDPGALPLAVEWSRAGLHCLGEGDGGPELATALATLGRVLSLTYEETGDLDALDEALRLLERAAGISRLTRALRAEVPFYLASVLLHRVDRFEDGDALERAVEALAAAEAAIPIDHPERSLYLATLASALRARFEWRGRPEDLTEAVRVARRAVENARRDNDLRISFALAGLGMVLTARYTWFGSVSDIDDAVDAWREAVAVLPPDNIALGPYRGQLAMALVHRYGHRRDRRDADEAVEAARAAVEAEVEPLARAEGLALLAHALRSRGAVEELPEDVVESVEHLREAVSICPAGTPRRPAFQGALALSLMVHLRDNEDRALADEAVAAAREALDAADADDPRRPSIVNVLALILAGRASLNEDEADTEEAVALLQEATGSGIGPAPARFMAARLQTGLESAREHWDAALDACRTAMAELPRLAWHGFQRDDLLDALTRTDGLARTSAAIALNAGQPETALRLLEEGRGVLLARSLDARDDMAELAERVPDLADHIRRVRALLNVDPTDLVAAEAIPGLPTWSRALAGDRRRELSEELDDLVEQVRALPGFEDFQRLPSMERLQGAAAGGPVVVVNVSDLRCDALIVTADGVEPVSLPDLEIDGAEGLTERTRTLLRSLASLSDGEEAVRRANRDLEETLEWLRRVVVDPVMRALADAEVTSGRLWWCPTGDLALLPLHAAGPESFVYSYTATVRALSSQVGKVHASQAELLAVDLSATPGLPPLPHAKAEVGALLEAVPDATLLEGPDAHRDAVLRGLESHALLHFAGHGAQDPARFPGGALFCHDHPLTLADLAHRRSPSARLAYLSACETAWGAEDLPDEALHLAGAMQLAGFDHVVAAQWSVDDVCAVATSMMFYKGLTDPTTSGTLNPDKAATALHAATTQLRRQDTPTLLWASYVHIGP
ncbi:CHAT domain-containing protein [Glycomyces sp. NPDC046736]|uniref:CHAT domain-containing protein n=1 Tax=Glycomyces sp. NPDC046736 TaxID=3155615 RepID=UPI0033CAA121